MLSRETLKEIARERVRERRGIAIGGFAVYSLIVAAVSGITQGLGTLIIGTVLTVGYAFFCTSFYLGESAEIGDIFNASFSNFGRKLGGMLWMELFTFLWSLLLIIPGIIKAISYSMTPYILANEPDVEATEALKISMRMTEGHKMEIFIFELSFLGWHLLSLLTLGILELVYVGPYLATATAGLYQELRRDALESGRIFENELKGFKLQY